MALHDPTKEMEMFLYHYNDYKKDLDKMYGNNEQLKNQHLMNTYNNTMKWRNEEQVELYGAQGVKGSLQSINEARRKLMGTDGNGKESGWSFLPTNRKMSEQAKQFFNPDGAMKDFLEVIHRSVAPVSGVSPYPPNDRRYGVDGGYIKDMTSYYDPERIDPTEGKINPFMDAIFNGDFSKVNRPETDKEYKQYSGTTFFPEGLKMAKETMDIGNPNSLLGRLLSGNLPVRNNVQGYSPIGRGVIDPSLTGIPMPNSLTEGDKFPNFNATYGYPALSQLQNFFGMLESRLKKVNNAEGIKMYNEELKGINNKKDVIKSQLGVLNGF